ncbi:hypothetical protein Droror1_Dr00015209 [Drosera rotundifolia]
MAQGELWRAPLELLMSEQRHDDDGRAEEQGSGGIGGLNGGSGLKFPEKERKKCLPFLLPATLPVAIRTSWWLVEVWRTKVSRGTAMVSSGDDV